MLTRCIVAGAAPTFRLDAQPNDVVIKALFKYDLRLPCLSDRGWKLEAGDLIEVDNGRSTHVSPYNTMLRVLVRHVPSLLAWRVISPTILFHPHDWSPCWNL